MRLTRFVILRTDVDIPHYWGGGGIWTTEPADAIRFYHKSDAYAAFTLDRLPQDGHIPVDAVLLAFLRRLRTNGHA